MTQNNALQFLNLTGIFEPSAVQQLADGRVSSAPLGSSESGEPPRVAAALQTLDLGGNGIRGMSYVSALGGYLLISGPAASADVHFAL